jgi:hypothetical protein
MKRNLLMVMMILCVALLFMVGCAAETVKQKIDGTNNAQVTEDKKLQEEQGSYEIVDTGQALCYDNEAALQSFPKEGDPFYGQDAQYDGNQPSYTLSDDEKTVYDNVTGLTWQRSPNTTNTMPVFEDKKTYEQALKVADELNAMEYGGYSDWRLPTIKEQYSLILFSGKDCSGFSGDTSVLTPFIDTNYFNFAFGDESHGERVLESQYFSTTTFINNPGDRGIQKQFGVNFADGRIKGYDITSPMGDKLFFVQCVRGNENYGINDFVDNGDLTVTDNATGLMWAKDDSGSAMPWLQALAFVQKMNDENYLGYSDWRLPNAKELQSIVDYRNSPEYNDKPAIDVDYFNSTSFTNEEGELDYGYYWTGTTHSSYRNEQMNDVGRSAVYVSFGRSMGYQNNQWMNVHGAGAQRSDPKIDDFSMDTLIKQVDFNGIIGYSFGPQGDGIRGSNFIRLVRDAN